MYVSVFLSLSHNTQQLLYGLEEDPLERETLTKMHFIRQRYQAGKDNKAPKHLSLHQLDPSTESLLLAKAGGLWTGCWESLVWEHCRLTQLWGWRWGKQDSSWGWGSGTGNQNGNEGWSQGITILLEKAVGSQSCGSRDLAWFMCMLWNPRSYWKRHRVPGAGWMGELRWLWVSRSHLK